MKPPSRIHRGLTRARDLVGRSYLADPDLRREYERDIAPRTEAALAHVFAMLALPAPRRVLDLGAGTGAAGRATLSRWPAATLVAVDKVEGPGIVGADLTKTGRLPGVEGRFDLLLAAHVLNELAVDVDEKTRMVLGWCRELLADDGHCILLEPALRQTSRGLLALRDRLVAAGAFVVAPCLWQGPCPALRHERDFCHASAGVIAQGRSRVDFSYLVLRHKGTACGDDERFRVVSDLIEDKGRLRFFACGPAGRVQVTRLDRDDSPSNHQAQHLVRGDLVRIHQASPRADGLRCTPGTVITRE